MAKIEYVTRAEPPLLGVLLMRLNWSIALKYTRNTSAAPTNAPMTWAAMYGRTFIHGNLRRTANASVTAGLMWAPLTPPATQTAKATAIAQPQVISSQSPAALKIVSGPAVRPDPGRPATATATTPSPNAIRTNVPKNSESNSPQSPEMRPMVRPSPRKASGVISAMAILSCRAGLSACALGLNVRLASAHHNEPRE